MLLLISTEMLSCTFTHGSQQTVLRHGDAMPSCDETRCMKCSCTYGTLSCTPVQNTVPDYALNARGGSCWKDNRAINHGEQIMVRLNFTYLYN